MRAGEILLAAGETNVHAAMNASHVVGCESNVGKHVNRPKMDALIHGCNHIVGKERLNQLVEDILVDGGRVARLGDVWVYLVRLNKVAEEDHGLQVGFGAVGGRVHRQADVYGPQRSLVVDLGIAKEPMWSANTCKANWSSANKEEESHPRLVGRNNDGQHQLTILS